MSSQIFSSDGGGVYTVAVTTPSDPKGTPREALRQWALEFVAINEFRTPSNEMGTYEVERVIESAKRIAQYLDTGE